MALQRSQRGRKFLDPKDMLRFKNLLFSARTVVEGLYAGRHRSPYRGSSPEFVDYREYYPGDEIKSIDWKAFARTDRYFIRLFERETDLRCHILLDVSASMGFGGREHRDFFPDRELSKLEYASHLAAALIYLMVKQGDQVSLTTFDEKVQRHIPPAGTFSHVYALLNALEQQRAARRTAVAEVLAEACPLFRRRGLVVVISDLLEEPAALFRALNQYRHRGMEVILFHIFHKYEYHLPPVPNVHFIDAEEGASITVAPDDVRREYCARVDAFVEALRTGARSRKIDYNLVVTDAPHSAVLEKYLLRRSVLG